MSDPNAVRHKDTEGGHSEVDRSGILIPIYTLSFTSWTTLRVHYREAVWGCAAFNHFIL